MQSSQSKLLSFVLYLIILVFAVYFLFVAKAILIPLVISITIAYSIASLESSFLELSLNGRHIPKWVAFLAAILSVVFALLLLVNLVVDNVAQVVERAPGYEARLLDIIEQVSASIGAERMQSIVNVFANLDLASVITAVISPLSVIAGNTLTILFYVSFILVERQTLRPKLKLLVSDPKREAKIELSLTRIEHSIRKYLWIKSLISFLTAGFSYVVMRFLEIDFAAFWAVLIFVLNFIPYVGSILAVIFPVMLTLVQFQSLSYFLMTMVLLTGVQIVVGNVLEPRIMGKSLNLSPLVILLTLAVWWSIWGVVGMMICVPMMVIAMIIFAQFPQTRPIAILMSQEGLIDDLVSSEQTE